MRARTRTARKSASAPSGWSGSSGWRDRRMTRELAVVGEESAVVAHLEDEVVERAVQGEAGVADELERAGSAGGAGHRAGGRGVRANLVQALVRRRGGGRANRRRRGRRRRRRAGIRDREADERRHDERARERDERSARGAGGRRRPASQRGGATRGTHRRLALNGNFQRTARGDASVGFASVGRARVDLVRGRDRGCGRGRVGGGDARGGEARPQTRAAKWAGPTDTGRGERSSSAVVSPAAALGQHSSARQSSQPRPVSGISSIERWFRSVRIETVRANTTDRPGIVPVSPPAVARPITCCQHITRRGTTAAFLVPRGGRRLVRERGRDIPASRATRDARRYRAGASLPRALSRRTSPLSRASVRVPHRPLTAPAPPLRSDRSPRRHSPGSSSVSTMSTCAALSSGARSLRASPAPCVKRAGARRGSPATTCRAAPAPRRDAARRVASATVGGIALASSLAPARAENLEGVAGDAASNAADAAAAQAAQAARAAADASAAVGDALGGVAGGAASVASSAADAARRRLPGRRRSRRRQRRRVLPRRRARRRRSPRVRRRRPRRRVGLGRRRRPRRRRRRRSGGAQPRRVRREGLRRG